MLKWITKFIFHDLKTFLYLAIYKIYLTGKIFDF